MQGSAEEAPGKRFGTGGGSIQWVVEHHPTDCFTDFDYILRLHSSTTSFSTRQDALQLPLHHIMAIFSSPLAA